MGLGLGAVCWGAAPRRWRCDGGGIVASWLGVGVRFAPVPLSQAACSLLPAVRSPEGKIRLYCKGADTILLERLHPVNQDLTNVTTDHLNVSGAGSCGQGWERKRGCPEARSVACVLSWGAIRVWGHGWGSACAPSSGRLQEYAGEGLRTLVLAYKDLEESYYEDWSERLHRAGSAPEAREDRLARLYDEVEHDMMVCGGLGTLRGGVGGSWGAALGDLLPVWVP